MRQTVMLLTIFYLIYGLLPCAQFVDYTVWLFVDTFTLAWRILAYVYIGVFIVAIWGLVMHALGLWDN